MSRRKLISVIGGLSIDHIHLTSQALSANSSVVQCEEEHSELGGRAVNIAVAISRLCRRRPQTDDGLLPERDDDDEDDEESVKSVADALADLALGSGSSTSASASSGSHSASVSSPVEIRIIGAVANEEQRERFASLLRRNGVNPKGLRIVEGEKTEQDKLMTIVDARQGNTQLFSTSGVSKNWSPDDFNSVAKLGAGARPDLVVVTMEIQRPIVEQIIDTAFAVGVEVCLYASPASAGISFAHYSKLTHLICNDIGAEHLLGLGQDERGPGRWMEMVRDFGDLRGVSHVAIKMGRRCAVYKSGSTEGYLPGYQNERQGDVIEASGATSAFVAAYVVHYLRPRRARSPWDMASAVKWGNQAWALTGRNIGYHTALPWRDQLNNFRAQPLPHTLNDLIRASNRVAQPWEQGHNRVISLDD